jgi:sortase (surface protein transpeptidase)
MAPTQEARLTLITCWPDWAYTHRLIVSARLALP